jgi:hypothetical protein
MLAMVKNAYSSWAYVPERSVDSKSSHLHALHKPGTFADINFEQGFDRVA